MQVISMNFQKDCDISDLVSTYDTKVRTQTSSAPNNLYVQTPNAFAYNSVCSCVCSSGRSLFRNSFRRLFNISPIQLLITSGTCSNEYITKIIRVDSVTSVKTYYIIDYTYYIG